MVIFLLISAAFILLTHRAVMKSVNDYNYGSHEEWREFERQFKYEDAVRR